MRRQGHDAKAAGAQGPGRHLPQHPDLLLRHPALEQAGRRAAAGRRAPRSNR